MPITLQICVLTLVILALSSCTGLGGMVSPTSSQERETGRDYLIGQQTEKEGYGLYSYLLFGSPPTAVTRDRYHRAIAAYVTIPPITSIEESLPRWQLNVTYLLLTEPPPPEITQCLQSQCISGDVDRVERVAQWVFEHYHYARARVLLRALPGSHTSGPYIISYSKPLIGFETRAGPYLYQNLSAVPPHLVLSWVNEFLSQAAQERFWEERTIKQLSLKLFTAIEIRAEGLPDVLAALDKLIVLGP
jgi:hypothetical protein